MNGGDRAITILISLAGVIAVVVQGFFARRQNRSNSNLSDAQAAEIIQRTASKMLEDQGQQVSDLRTQLVAAQAELTAAKAELNTATAEIVSFREQLHSMAAEAAQATVEITRLRALLTQHGIPFEAGA